jgi:hypothetical protein
VLEDQGVLARGVTVLQQQQHRQTAAAQTDSSSTDRQVMSVRAQGAVVYICGYRHLAYAGFHKLATLSTRSYSLRISVCCGVPACLCTIFVLLFSTPPPPPTHTNTPSRCSPVLQHP